jgi:hypothetical protein
VVKAAEDGSTVLPFPHPLFSDLATVEDVKPFGAMELALAQPIAEKARATWARDPLRGQREHQWARSGVAGTLAREGPPAARTDLAASLR